MVVGTPFRSTHFDRIRSDRSDRLDKSFSYRGEHEAHPRKDAENAERGKNRGNRGNKSIEEGFSGSLFSGSGLLGCGGFAGWLRRFGIGARHRNIPHYDTRIDAVSRQNYFGIVFQGGLGDL